MNLCLSKRQLLLNGKKAKTAANCQQNNACRMSVHNNPKPPKTTYSGRVTPLQAGLSRVTFCFVASQ